jgi:hypothetical protein
MATIAPATTAKNAPTADSPTPGPTYAMACPAKRDDKNMKQAKHFIKR